MDIVTLEGWLGYKKPKLLRRIHLRIKWSLESLECWLGETWQKWTLGYSYVETSNLCNYVAKYTLPRLRCLRPGCGPPCGLSEDEWQEMLGKMIYALELVENDNEFKDYEGAKEGLVLFGEWLPALWN